MSDTHAMIDPLELGPTSHTFMSQRLRLHYVDWGNADAPPMILLHGGRDHCRSWDWVARALRGDYHIIAPDLRGHGDSQWSPDGNYAMTAHIYDLAQIIHQTQFQKVTIIAHSWGGSIALRYAGIFPEMVEKLIVIEGLGAPPLGADQSEVDVADRFRGWISDQRKLSGLPVSRYGSIDDALKRMQEANRHLTPVQARHLTVHGVSQNEDGTYSWKFDNYVRSISPVDITPEQRRTLWSRIACPTLLAWGRESWVSNPAQDGSLRYFQDARVVEFDNAGHWLHHDQLPAFLAAARQFLSGE